MPEPIAFLFPGQGSQSVGMGRILAQQFACAREAFLEADDVLGVALSRLCFAGPMDALSLTENTQPALLACSWAVARVLVEELGMRPRWAAGHSLGEFTALVSAGAITFPAALRVVRERGRAMQAAVPAGEGAMAAVLGLDAEAVVAACEEAAQAQVVSAANFNAPAQVVIAGHRAAVERAAELAKARGAKRVLPLPVSAPFHCALMRPAAERLNEVLAETEICAPSFTVLSNVDAEVHSSPGAIRERLVRQVVAPVRWQQCVARLEALGCRRALEVGPGKVLTNLVKRISPAIQCLPAENPQEALAFAA